MDNFNYDSDSSSSSSNCELSITRKLLDEQAEDNILDVEMDIDVVQTCAIQVPLIVSPGLLKQKILHGGSNNSRCYINRDRKRHDVIVKDYFSGENSKYTPDQFRRRFRMSLELFELISKAVQSYDSYFTWKIDAVGKLGLSPLQKILASVRMLAYGCPADSLDEYIQIGETTVIESLKRFCESIIGIFEKQYLRKPNEEDIARLLEEGEHRGFPGMLGSLDCMHWHWKNCPTAWYDTHTNGYKKVPTLILEIVASHNLWIWHAFFGMAGTNNDINVLDRSPLFDDLINETAPSCDFVVNGHHYDMGYYLSDGVYPQYATLIETISSPSSMKEKLFAKCQEAARKDVERAFGVLQSRWYIVKGPARMWNAQDLESIMKTCIILHNMIIENESSQGINPESWQPEQSAGHETIESVIPEHDFTYLVSRMTSRMKEIQNKTVHKELKSDLINHLWDLHGGQHVD